MNDASANARTILIVDDDPDARFVLREALSGRGYDVVEAVNGLDGLRLAYAVRPDLILLDAMMPTMDGRGFLDARRAHREIARIPVIIVSAAWADDLAGAVAHLEKPVSLRAVLRAVERWTAPLVCAEA
jgi:CheY-like chemotaxis protein